MIIIYNCFNICARCFACSEDGPFFIAIVSIAPAIETMLIYSDLTVMLLMVSCGGAFANVRSSDFHVSIMDFSANSDLSW